MTIWTGMRMQTGPFYCNFMSFCYSFATMVIRMRHTRAHTANRRSHHALKAPTLATCANCSAKHRPHHMCQDCGFYKGRLVIDMKAKKEAREARMLAKKERREGERAEAEADQLTAAVDAETKKGDQEPVEVKETEADSKKD